MVTSSRIRGTLTLRLNRLQGYVAVVRDIMTPLADGEPPSREQLVELRRHHRFIADVLARVEESQAAWSSFIDGLDEEEQAAEQRRYDEYQAGDVHFARFLDLVAELQSQVAVTLEEADATSEVSHRTSVIGVVAGGRAEQQGHEGRRQNLRLPKIPLKDFSGEPRDWPAFDQCFEYSVHRQDIPDVEKCTYLVQLQKGPAARAMEGYAITGENYPVLRALLRRRFGEKTVISESLEAELINLPSASDEVASLRGLSEAFDRICRQFSQLGLDENSALFVTTAKSKLPQSVLVELVKDERKWKRANGRAWGMPELREALAEYIDVREDVLRCVKAVKGRGKGPTEGVGDARKSATDKQGKATTRTFAAVTQATTKAKGQQGELRDQSAKPPPQCLFCESQHWATDCSITKRKETLPERRRKLQEQNRCLRCLRRGHAIQDCRAKVKCRLCKSSDHHGAMCPAPKETAKSQSAGGPTRAVVSAASTVGEEEPAQLMTTMAWVAANEAGKKAKAVIFFDPGSQVSFIRRSFADQLEAEPLDGRDLLVYPFGASRPNRITATRHRLSLRGLNSGLVEKLDAYATDKIGTRIPVVTRERDGSVHTAEREPDVLVGLNDFWRMFIAVDENDGRVTVRTVLGEVLCGEWPVESRGGKLLSYSVRSQEVLPEPRPLHDFWALETIGICDDPSVTKSEEDKAALVAFLDTVSQGSDGRYRVGWPWRHYPPDLANNFGLAYGWLEALLKQAKNVGPIGEAIGQLVQLQLVEPAARRLGELEYFLPYFLVFGKKARLVWHASSHARGAKSLNECLLKGPVDLHQLLAMLLRFRMSRFPLLADVEKAFLQLELRPEDREVCKFLWVGDPSLPLSTDNLRIFRFTRVAFGVASSPFLLQATLQHHLQRYVEAGNNNNGPEEGTGGEGDRLASPITADEGETRDPALEATPTNRSRDEVGEAARVAAEMADNTYVDNVLMGAESINEAVAKARCAHRIFREAQMNLREFVCPAPGFAEAMPRELLLPPTPINKVLGVEWHSAGDELLVPFPDKPVGRLSKRAVLKVVAGIYDPLGLISPCLLPAKLLLQRVAEEEWDTLLPAEEQSRWREIEDAWLSRRIRIPRRIIVDRTAQIHTCVDASKDAYACAVYVRWDSGNSKSTANVSLAFAKSRLRPKRAEMSIPRLELTAMVIGVRASEMVQREMRLDGAPVFLWGDSKPVLSWLNSRDQLPRYVSNRVAEIRRHDNITYGYVNTADNPADHGTRGVDPDGLQQLAKWWRGPEWLLGPESNWPKDLIVRIEHVEVGPVEAPVVAATRVVATAVDDAIDWSRFNNWALALRTVIVILRFAALARREEPEPSWQLAKKARVALIRLAQHGVEAEIARRKLAALQDSDGIWRLTTRINNSAVDDDFKNPVLLAKSSPLTRLLITHTHERLYHAGVDHTLTGFLSRYWASDARRLVKKVVRGCGRCIRIRGPAFALPTMPPLPADRVRERRAFEVCGVDYFGPTLTRSPAGDRVKTWIVLVTCLTTRATYLAPAWSLTTDEFLHILRRFIARRGRPRRLLSDNGAQFVAAAKALGCCTTPLCEIEWSFIGPLSPWQGGVYERLVGAAKSAFKAALGRQLLAFHEMETFAAEVEAALNYRPLTFVSAEADGPVPLRPIDFIQPGAKLDMPEVGADGTKLGRMWHSVKSALGTFWRRFNTEYLLVLREKAGWCHRQPKSRLRAAPRLGDVVLIEDYGHPRNLWPLGRIVELEVRSGAVRNVKLEIVDKGSIKGPVKKRIIGRPVSKIYPLEAQLFTADGEDSPYEKAEKLVEPSTTTPESEADPAEPTLDNTAPLIKPGPSSAKRTHRMVTRGQAKKAMAAVMIMTWANGAEAAPIGRMAEELAVIGVVFLAAGLLLLLRLVLLMTWSDGESVPESSSLSSGSSAVELHLLQHLPADDTSGHGSYNNLLDIDDSEPEDNNGEPAGDAFLGGGAPGWYCDECREWHLGEVVTPGPGDGNSNRAEPMASEPDQYSYMDELMEVETASEMAGPSSSNTATSDGLGHSYPPPSPGGENLAERLNSQLPTNEATRAQIGRDLVEMSRHRTDVYIDHLAKMTTRMGRTKWATEASRRLFNTIIDHRRPWPPLRRTTSENRLARQQPGFVDLARATSLPARLPALVCLSLLLAAVSATEVTAPTCRIECGGGVIKVELDVERAYWCCGDLPCKEELGPTHASIRGEAEECEVTCKEGERLLSHRARCDSPPTTDRVQLTPALITVGILAAGGLLAGAMVRWHKGRTTSSDTEQQSTSPPEPGTSTVREPARDADGYERVDLEAPTIRRGIEPGTAALTAAAVAMLLLPTESSALLSIECTTTGLKGSITGHNTVRNAELCCGQGSCWTVEGVWEKNLPMELLVNDYDCELRVTIRNGSTDAFESTLTKVHCEEIEKCLALSSSADCWWCRLTNPSCFPVFSAMAYGVTLAFALTIICACISICRESCRNCRAILRPCRCILRCCGHAAAKVLKRKKRDSTTTTPATHQALLPSSRAPTYQQSSNTIGPGQGMRLALGLAILLAFATQTVADDAAVVGMPTEECYEDRDGRWCEWSFNAVATLLPSSQRLSLLLKSKREEITEGAVHIRLIALQLRCVADELRWTYPHSVATESHKRCPGMGTCSSADVCDKIKPDDQVAELQKCQSWPSVTKCLTSCSSWWCGCAIGPLVERLFRGCLFFCHYASPATPQPTPHRVFECPTWEYRLRVEITIDSDNATDAIDAALVPGMTFEFGNLSFTPLAISLPPAPGLAERFISDGKVVALAGDVSDDLHCASYEHAANASCSLDPTVCSDCQPDAKEAKVRCQCRDPGIELAMEAMQLPRDIGGIHLQNEGGHVFSEVSYAPVQLRVRAKNLRLSVIQAWATGWVTPVALHGAYGRAAAAELHFRCRTSTGEALIEVSCDDGTAFVQRCREQEELFNVSLTYDTATVDTTCRAKGPAGVTEFRLQGELIYLPHRDPRKWRSEIGNEANDDSGGFGATWLAQIKQALAGFDVWAVVWLLTDWRWALGIAATTCVALLVLNVSARRHPVHRAYKVLWQTATGSSPAGVSRPGARRA